MRRSTIVYLFLFAIALTAAYFFNNRSETPDPGLVVEPTTAPIEYMFTSADGLPTRIRIESRTGEVVEVSRNEENAWVVILPEEAAADQGSVEAAASQVTTMRILERVPGLAPDAAGLDDPEYRLDLRFTSGVERMTEIGVLTPTERGYYARGQNNEIVIVSSSAVDALLGLLTAPPYAPLETPPPAAP